MELHLLTLHQVLMRSHHYENTRWGLDSERPGSMYQILHQARLLSDVEWRGEMYEAESGTRTESDWGAI